MSDIAKTLTNILVSGMIFIDKFAPFIHSSVHLNLSYDFWRIALLKSYRFDESKWI